MRKNFIAAAIIFNVVAVNSPALSAPAVISSDPVLNFKRAFTTDPSDPVTVANADKPRMAKNAIDAIPEFLAQKSHEEDNSSELMLVNIMNSLHEKPGIRFLAISKVDASGIYQLLTKGRQNLFTSTFNYLYDDFISKLKSEKKTFSSFLAEDPSRINQLSTFMNGLSTFGKTSDFNARIGLAEKKLLIDILMARTEKSNIASITLADFADHLEANDPALAKFENDVADHYASTKSIETKDVLGLVASWYAHHDVVQTPGLKNFYGRIAEAPRYETLLPTELKADRLWDSQGRNFQLHVFYSDSDGIANYQSFNASLAKSGWQRVKDTAEFASFKKTQQGKTIFIYETKPYSKDQTSSILAAKTDALAQGGKITALFHRGHTYWGNKTIEAVDQDTQFLFLGACGGTQFAQMALRRNPDIQIEATASIGTRAVNERLISVFNQTLLSGSDIKWKDVDLVLSRIPSIEAKNYILPSDNMAAAFIKKLLQFRAGTAPAAPSIK